MKFRCKRCGKVSLPQPPAVKGMTCTCDHNRTVLGHWMKPVKVK